MRAVLVVSCAFFLFAKAETGKPINIPPHCVGWNEEIKCVNDCPPQRTCKTREAQFKCGAQDEDKCETKCVCKEGFFRNPLGDCISNEQCDQCTGPHEYYACNSACDNVCATLHEQNQTNCPIVNFKCNERCYCEQGYARDEEDVCVPIAECHQCSGPHEYFACRGACDNVCATLHSQNQTNCPIVNGICNPNCYCEQTHARDEGNLCVPIEECPKNDGNGDLQGHNTMEISAEILKDKGQDKKCTGQNEEFNACKRLCPPELCYSIVARFRCPDAPCVAGCACKPGFLRKAEGDPCVPTRECPELANSPDFH